MSSYGSCDREMETYYLRTLFTLCIWNCQSTASIPFSRNSRRIRSPPNLRKLSIFRSSRDLFDFFKVIATMNILFIELNDISVAVPGHLKNRRWSVAFRVKLQVPLLSLFTRFEQSSTRRCHANNSGWHVTLSSYPRSATTSGAVSASFSVFQNSLCSFSCLNFDLPPCVDYLGNVVGRTWASAWLSGDLYPRS